ncbi:hypothetical protein KCU89_g18808, partial [Aureobasidium melanogenum]
PSYSLPSAASTYGITVSNITTTFTYTNTFHKPVSKTWLTTQTYQTTIGAPDLATTSQGSAAKNAVGAIGAFALGVAALL